MPSVKNTKPKDQGRLVQGLTVLEFLIGIAAIAIVVLVSIPGSTLLLEKYRLKTTETSLLQSLELAKLESQSRNSTVVVCPSSNGHSCRRDDEWNHGWIVFSDGNGNGTVQEIELIRSFEKPHQRIRIEATGATRSRASFNMTGLISDHDSLTGNFRICHDGSSAAPKLIEVETDGWVKRLPAQDGSCEQG
jgi:type IV fimbrial biogenesis protein FimT